MSKEPGIVPTIVLIALAVLAVPVTVLLGTAYEITPLRSPAPLVAALVLPVIVIGLGTGRSIWHRRSLLSSQATTLVGVILLIGTIAQLAHVPH